MVAEEAPVWGSQHCLELILLTRDMQCLTAFWNLTIVGRYYVFTLSFLCLCWQISTKDKYVWYVHAYLCGHIIKVCEHSVSYKLLVGISPNLQLRFSWGKDEPVRF